MLSSFPYSEELGVCRHREQAQREFDLNYFIS